MNKIITKTKLLKQIKKYFPLVKWKTTRYINSGYDNDLIILDNALAFRFPKNNYSKKIFKKEIGILGVIKKQVSISVPDYIYVSKDYSCGAYPLIKGWGLTINKYRSLSKRQKRNLAKQIAVFLTQLHATSLASVKRFNISERFPDKELAKLHKEARKYLYFSFSQKEQDVFENFFSDLSVIFKHKYKKVLVHGDFSGDHFIINTKNKLEGIIDFTDKAIHDPAFDFIFLWHFGPKFIKFVYRNYAGAGKKGLIKRSNLYARASAIWNMVHSKKKRKDGYSQWYQKFKKLSTSNLGGQN